MHNLEQLSDYDFEQVVADLLTAEWRVRVESFPRGRDGGVDLRVLGPVSDPLNLPAGNELVVQCKHMPHATIAQLRRPLREEAAKKIVGRAYRYILVTSARLTRGNKQEVVSIFSGRLDESDIFGRDDVDSLMRRHPDVVRANVKLWLSSDIALHSFLNQVEYLRSSLLQTELEQLRPRFVQTSAVVKAHQMLRRYGICVLAGAPGVGKTTTGKILLLRYLSEGWRPIVAVSDVRELETQLLPGVKQILFFDDFLGATGLPAKLARGDDSALIRLIRLIENDSSKAFVLTTREYILRQAQQDYEKLNDDAFNVMKLVIDIESLTPAERAHILYNQLYFSPLRSAAATAPDGPKRYMELTGHPNFNPRLIEATIAAAVRDLKGGSDRLMEAANLDDVQWHHGDHSSSSSSSSDPGVLDLPALLRRSLDHPERLWEHVFLHQLTQLQRGMLVTRLSLGTEIVNITNFLRAASNLVSEFENVPTQLALRMAFNVLDGDLLSVTRQSTSTDAILVDTLNPGVADSVTALLHAYPEYLDALVASACTFEQVQWIAEFLGIGRARNSHGRSAVLPFSTEVIACAERNLFSLPISALSVLSFEQHAFSYFGMRLELLSAIYESANRRSRKDFADKVVPHFLENISKVPSGELVRVLMTLRSDTFQEWRSRRTEIKVAVLSKLDDAQDTYDWSLLRDALDLIGTTREYEEELKERFVGFLDDWIADASDAAEEARDDDQVDLPTDELDELESLAARWEVHSIDLSDLAEEFEEIAHRRGKIVMQRASVERNANQPTLFESIDTGTKLDGSIFDHL